MSIVIGLDIETTGTDTAIDRIVQIAMVKFELYPFNLIEKKVNLINPTIPIPEGASKVHGITDIMVEKSIKFKDFAPALFKYLNDCDYILTHNGKKFDIPLIIEEFFRCNIEWIPKPIIDTYVIMSNFIPRTLEGAYSYYCNGAKIENAHDAEGDVLTTIKVLFGQISEHDLNIEDNLESALISESKYKNEDRNLTYDGKIILNDEGVAVFNFGKLKGNPITSADLGYLNWFFMSNFPVQTKNVLKSLINK